LIAAGAALLSVAVVIVTALFVGEGRGGGGDADGDSIRGVAVLVDTSGDVTGSWDDCEGTGGYDDFSAGMRLSIKGGNDEIVGTGHVVNVDESRLEDVVKADWDGKAIGLEHTDDMDAATDELRDLLESGEGTMCMLYFEADVDRSDYYSIELGSRGDLSFSRKELADDGYVVGISLGDL